MVHCAQSPSIFGPFILFSRTVQFVDSKKCGKFARSTELKLYDVQIHILCGKTEKGNWYKKRKIVGGHVVVACSIDVCIACWNDRWLDNTDIYLSKCDRCDRAVMNTQRYYHASEVRWRIRECSRLYTSASATTFTRCMASSTLVTKHRMKCSLRHSSICFRFVSRWCEQRAHIET